MTDPDPRPTGADVVITIQTPAGPRGAWAMGLFVEPDEQRRIDRIRAEYAQRQQDRLRR